MMSLVDPRSLTIDLSMVVTSDLVSIKQEISWPFTRAETKGLRASMDSCFVGH